MCKCSEGLDHQILCIALIEHLNYRCLYIDTYKSRTESVSYIMIPSTHPTLLGHLQAGSSIPQKLQTAYTMFKAFCKHSRATPFVKSFTRDNLGWDSFAKYPEASFKGSDVKLLLGFLVDFMYHDETHQVNQVCCFACCAMHGWLPPLGVYSESVFFIAWRSFSCFKLFADVACKNSCLCEGLLRSKIGLFQFNPEVPLPATCQRWHQKAIRFGVDWNFKPCSICHANGRRLHWQKLPYCENDTPVYSCAKNRPEMASILPTVVDKWSARCMCKNVQCAGSMWFRDLRRLFLRCMECNSIYSQI